MTAPYGPGRPRRRTRVPGVLTRADVEARERRPPAPRPAGESARYRGPFILAQILTDLEVPKPVTVSLHVLLLLVMVSSPLRAVGSEGLAETLVIAGVAAAAVTAVVSTSNRALRRLARRDARTVPPELVVAPDVSLPRSPVALLFLLGALVTVLIVLVLLGLTLNPWYLPAAAAAGAAAFVVLRALPLLPVLSLNRAGFVLTRGGEVVRGRLWTQCRQVEVQHGVVTVTPVDRPGAPDRPDVLSGRFGDLEAEALARLLEEYRSASTGVDG